MKKAYLHYTIVAIILFILMLLIVLSPKEANTPSNDISTNTGLINTGLK